MLQKNITIEYEAYAFDESVRTAYLADKHGFLVTS